VKVLTTLRLSNNYQSTLPVAETGSALLTAILSPVVELKRGARE
jgi:hypothetical protein